MRAPAAVLLATLTLLAFETRAAAGEAVVAASADFADVARFLAAEYGARSGDLITIEAGAADALCAAVRAGAGADAEQGAGQGAGWAAILGGDAEGVRALEAEGLLVPGSRVAYALGRLALWSADPARIGGDGAAALAGLGPAERLAIADPARNPSGRAAMAALAAMGLAEALAGRIDRHPDGRAAWAAAARGEAAMSLGAASLAGEGVAGSLWILPETIAPPLRQEAGLLRAGAGNAAAQGFLDYLDVGTARGYIRSRGYDTPLSAR